METVMAEPRTAFYMELAPNHHVKVDVVGPLDEELLSALQAFIDRRLKALPDSAAGEPR